MALYEVAAAFNAIDNISSVTDNIGKSIVGMANAGVDGLSNLADNGLDMATVATGGLNIAFGLAVGFMASVADDMAQLNQAAINYAVTTGQSGKAVDDFKKHTQDLFASGLVDNMKAAADIAGEVERRMKGVEGFNASSFETNVAAVAKAWDTNGVKLVDKTIEISNKFDDLKGKPNQVLDAIVFMAQQTGRPIDDITGKVDKFATKFANAGLDGKQSMELIFSALKAGMTDDAIGKLGAALDTLHSNLLKPNKAVDDALKKLGLGDLAKDVQTNKVPMDQAYDDIFQAINKLPTPAEKSAAMLALFGKSAQGAITPDMLDKMSGFAGSLDKSAGAASNVANIMKDDGTLGTAIKQFGNSFKVQVEQGLQDWYDMITKTDWAGAWKGFTAKFISSTGGVTTTLNDWNDKITAFLNKAAQAITGTGGGSGLAITDPNALPHAAGGMLDKGWNIVGEQGPELAFHDGGSTRIFSNSDSKQMVAAQSGGSGGGGGDTYITGNTFVGTGGLQELARMLYPGIQAEDQRRGNRN